jgi:hypothetical protein
VPEPEPELAPELVPESAAGPEPEPEAAAGAGARRRRQRSATGHIIHQVIAAPQLHETRNFLPAPPESPHVYFRACDHSDRILVRKAIDLIQNVQLYP